MNTFRSLIKAGLKTAAFIWVARSLGPKRIGRVAALATEMYLAHRARDRKRR